jgi:microcin C transport system substrate-binding protein
MKNRLFHLIFLSIPVLFMGILATATEKLPENIKWLTNDKDPIYASADAQKGGTYRDYMLSFPLTMRTVGPDSNSSFRSVISGNQMHLLDAHPNTENTISGLASHWAFGDDKKTMYFKIYKSARWSDGVPVTVDDFIFGLEFMRSKHIVAPWYNTYFVEKIDRVIKYDDHTLAIVANQPYAEIEVTVNSLPPQPKHFYKPLTKDFVKKYNWKIIPNLGPYIISDVKKGKSVTLKRKKNWWAKDHRYNKGRYNVDKVRITVIRDKNTVFEYFKKGKLDIFDITQPDYWHQKAKNTEIFTKGYAKKSWFYTDKRENASGIFLNQDKPLFKDHNVRLAFSHAMNYGKLITGLLRNDYSRLHGQNMGYGEYSNNNIKAREYDIAKVEELMGNAGWKRGSDGIWEKGKLRYSVTILYYIDFITDRLVFLKEEAKKAGIELKLQLMDGNAAFKLVLEKKHQAIRMAWSTSWRPQYWQGYHSANAHKVQTNNVTNTDDPELDKLIMKYRGSLSVEERIPLGKTIQQKIHDQAVFVPAVKASYFREMYWKWWNFPKVPATKSSDSLIEPFGTATFWLDQEEMETTKSAMKSGKTFEPVVAIDRTYQTK